MEEFPWGALAAAIAVIAASYVPVVRSLSADARLAKTVELLRSMKKLDPDAKAMNSLAETVDMLAAKKRARLEHGSYAWFYLLGMTFLCGWIFAPTLVIGLTSGTLWLLGIGTVAFLATALWQYILFLKMTHARL